MAFLKHGGYQIRGTVRNKQDPKKFAELLKAFGQEYLSQIELFDMELMDTPSIERAVAGCQFVVHVASPNPSKAPKDEQIVIKPAVQGTVALLKAAQKAKVKRVVVTCSIASIFMKTEKNHKNFYDESDWSDPEMCLSIHHKITYQKELAIWNFFKAQQANPAEHQVEVTALILGMVWGPTLVTHEFTVGMLMEQTMLGKVPGVAKMMFPLVDVRDSALAHLRALDSVKAKNQRIIVVSDNIWFKEMADLLSDHYKPHGYNIKTGEIKFWMLKVASWIDDTAKTILPQWDKEQRLSNKLSIDALGL